MIFDMTKRKSGGDPYAVARELIKDNVVEYDDPDATTLQNYAFYGKPKLERVYLHNLTGGSFGSVFNGPSASYTPKVTALALPKYVMNSWDGYRFQNNPKIKTLDFSVINSIPQYCFNGCGALNTLVLRKSSIIPMSNVSAVGSSAFKSGGAGGTIYIPKSLYDHLGDGTSSDYKAATNWATVDGYGTITWKSIESTHTDPNAPIDLTLYYADGTPIPTT